MQHLMNNLLSLVRDEDGQDLIEYALLAPGWRPFAPGLLRGTARDRNRRGQGDRFEGAHATPATTAP